MALHLDTLELSINMHAHSKLLSARALLGDCVSAFSVLLSVVIHINEIRVKCEMNMLRKRGVRDNFIHKFS